MRRWHNGSFVYQNRRTWNIPATRIADSDGHCGVSLVFLGLVELRGVSVFGAISGVDSEPEFPAVASSLGYVGPAAEKPAVEGVAAAKGGRLCPGALDARFLCDEWVTFSGLAMQHGEKIKTLN